jgi:hypothetical protein
MTPGDFEAAARILVLAGWESYQVAVMCAVGMAESGLNPAARNFNDRKPESPWYLTTDWSVWQINDSGDAIKLYLARGLLVLSGSIGKQLCDPLTNARCARTLFLNRGGAANPLAGYAAWAAFNPDPDTGVRPYLKFRPAGVRAAHAIGLTW